MQQGRLLEALPLLKQVLERRLQILPDDDPLIGSHHPAPDGKQIIFRNTF
jgi:hypothetical protein